MARSITFLPRFARPILALLTCVFLSVTASADTLVVSTNYNLAEDTYLMENDVDTATYAGEAGIVLDGTVNRTAFCVAIFTDINTNTVYNTTLADIRSVNNGLRVGWLLDDVFPTLTTPQQGAGLQLAIWDIVNDNADGFSSGNIQAATGTNATDPIALADAISYESQSVGKSAEAWVYNNTDVNTGTPVQTLMGFETFTDNGPTIPEPGTFSVVTLALVIAGVAWRRKRSPARSHRSPGLLNNIPCQNTVGRPSY